MNNPYHHVKLNTDDLIFLCEVLQPEIDKGDSGALQMYWEFQAIINPVRGEGEPHGD